MQPDNPMADMITCQCRYGTPDGWGHDCGWPDVPITPDAERERIERGGYNPCSAGDSVPWPRASRVWIGDQEITGYLR